MDALDSWSTVSSSYQVTNFNTKKNSSCNKGPAAHVLVQNGDQVVIGFETGDMALLNIQRSHCDIIMVVFVKPQKCGIWLDKQARESLQFRVREYILIQT